jgi:hypothetical protein
MWGIIKEGQGVQIAAKKDASGRREHRGRAARAYRWKRLVT